MQVASDFSSGVFRNLTPGVAVSHSSPHSFSLLSFVCLALMSLREFQHKVSLIPVPLASAHFQVSQLCVFTPLISKLIKFSKVRCQPSEVTRNTYKLAAMLAAVQSSGYNPQLSDTVAVGITSKNLRLQILT